MIWIRICIIYFIQMIITSLFFGLWLISVFGRLEKYLNKDRLEMEQAQKFMDKQLVVEIPYVFILSFFHPVNYEITFNLSEFIYHLLFFLFVELLCYLYYYTFFERLLKRIYFIDLVIFEHLYLNLLPLTIGPVLVGSHPITLLIWYAYNVFEVLTSDVLPK